IDGNGKVKEFSVPDGPDGADGPAAIVVGPGTQVWFTEPINSRIGMLDTATGAVTLRPAPTKAGGPLGLVRGPDGNLWFTEREANKVARLNRDGSFTEWKLSPGAVPNRIVVGPDKAVWFTELSANKIGRIDSAGHLTEMPLAGGPVGLTVGPDGHLYAALWDAKQIARLHDDGSLDRTWDLPHGALLVAAGPDSIWATNAFDDSVTSVQLSC
ncbi:MAG: virginiamycin lyase, partial [Pseudonocardiales bacterium]|nr:virginiamycin lyase [Pseudonocardiales bacterium]